MQTTQPKSEALTIKRDPDEMQKAIAEMKKLYERSKALGTDPFAEKVVREMRGYPPGE